MWGMCDIWINKAMSNETLFDINGKENDVGFVNIIVGHGCCEQKNLF